MRTVAIIQARMGSTRLPGKVLKTLCGKSVLGHVIERVAESVFVDDIVVATSDLQQDAIIVAETGKWDAKSFIGSELDVLDRYYHAARYYAAELVVRITSDCPLIDPVLIDDMLKKYKELCEKGEKVDYLSNTVNRTYPRGLDVELLLYSALETAHEQASAEYEREHVTPYIYQNPELFRIHQYTGSNDLSALRWTLDTEADWQFINAVYEQSCLSDQSISSVEDVLALLSRHPEIGAINSHIEQKPLVGL